MIIRRSLAAARESLRAEKDTVELLRGQITGLEQQIADKKKSGGLFGGSGKVRSIEADHRGDGEEDSSFRRILPKCGPS